MARIAVLGWGSLVNHPEGNAALGQTPLSKTGNWALTGPLLPLEFSRISKGKRLTLVIDPTHGTPNQVFTIQSGLSELNAAIENLRLREGKTKESWIGRLRQGDTVAAGVPALIAQWLRSTSYDAVVWTDIPSNFRDERGCDFSTAEAVHYLEALPESDSAAGYRYILETPDEITTNLRKVARWPRMVAVHEAGHFVVACMLNRPVVRLSRTFVDDRPGQPATIGCRYAHINETQPVFIASDVAGAWAQVTSLPDSVASTKLHRFQTRIVMPWAERNIYSWTGWWEDLEPVVNSLRLSPQSAAQQGIPPPSEILRLDQQVGAFFRRGDVAQAVQHVANALMHTPAYTDVPLAELRAEVEAMVSPNDGRAAILAGF